MKYMIIICLMAIPFSSICQDDVYGGRSSVNNPLTKGVVLPYKDGKVIYELVDSIPQIKQVELYAAAKKWLSDSFKSSKSVIQSENVQTGQIIGKGNTYVFAEGSNFLSGQSITINLSLQIDCREGKYRIRIYDIESVTNVARSIPDIITPIEVQDFGQRSKKNRVEKWEHMVYMINKRMESVLRSFSTSISVYVSDRF